MKYSMTALIVSLFALGSAATFAQPGQEGQEPGQQGQEAQPQAMDIQGKEFSELDRDGDGDLTQSEATEAGLEPVAFDALDENSDGQISEDEFEQAKEGGGAR